MSRILKEKFGTAVFSILVRHSSVQMITVENVRVGIVLRTVQITVLAYAIYELFTMRGFMEKTTPTGVTNTWATLPASVSEVLSGEDIPTYCGNPDFDFFYDSNFHYSDIMCRAFSPNEVVRKENTGIYLQSYLSETWVDREGCVDTHRDCQNVSKRTTEYFVPNIEQASIAIEHTGQAFQNYYPNVRLTLVSADGESLRTFAPGLPVQLPLHELLTAAGILSLDDDSPLAKLPESTGLASLRLTGLLHAAA